MKIHDEFLDRVHRMFRKTSPRAHSAYVAFDPEINCVDHVAFRTFDRGHMTLNVIEQWLLKQGYSISGEYEFPVRKVRAKSYSKSRAAIPRVFLSELQVDKTSPNVQNIVNKLIDVYQSELNDDFIQHRWKTISLDEYNTLLKEGGEYAAWVAVNGLMPNHMTVHVQDRIDNVLKKVVELGIPVASAGGSIKGGPHYLLEQGSTLADSINYFTTDNVLISVAGAYCEFAKRWVDPSTNELFDSFIEPSADKIFESTSLNDCALFIVKPDAMNRNLTSVLLTRLLNSGLSIKNARTTTLSLNESQQLYVDHQEKDFFNDLTSFMASGPCMLVEVTGHDCVKRLRDLVTSIRNEFATSIRENVVHGSDSSDSASRELKLFF
jgi:nucleoside diphosphate kinase